MGSLEIERKKLNVRRLETSKAELEFKILERMADVDRIKENISKQDDEIKKLKMELSN